eukprot:GGOE01043441.1.p3 GENE.GGOE01043441.1~~GGOE01043441.1.p3  ORF type:complete len:269 (-),score=63.09 GGOE01043441.1:123-929(-)
MDWLLWLLPATCVVLGMGVFLWITTPSREYRGPTLGSGKMFDCIARRYDLINRVMALGMDQGWRATMVRALELSPGDTCLDLATGTADVALILARTLRKLGGRGTVLGVDPSAKMLEEGRRKVQQANLTDLLTLQEGDAQELQLPDAHFDKVTMSFGIRNVEDRPRALREMRRVMKPVSSSRLVILEFADPEGGVLAFGARLFIRYGAPRIGALISGQVDEYMHLQNSIVAFPKPAAFAAMIEEAGFSVLRTQAFCFGSVCLYLARPR